MTGTPWRPVPALELGCRLEPVRRPLASPREQEAVVPVLQLQEPAGTELD
jgi:hypothetical protein